MTDIEFIANKLGIDGKFIVETKSEEEVIYRISGDENKKLEISNQLTVELLQKFHLEFKHCMFIQEIMCVESNTPPKSLVFCNYTAFDSCIFEEKVDFTNSIFLRTMDFTTTIFRKEVKFCLAKFMRMVNFMGAIFEKKVNFGVATFENGADFCFSIFKEEVDFVGVVFKEEVKFCRAKFTGIINFIGIFEKEANFSMVIFENKADFMLNVFKEKTDFGGVKFKDNVYFNNSRFYDYADFHECEFEKVASFYGVNFEKTPNFLQVIFKESLNLVNANLDFNFEDLKERIQELYKNNQDKQKPLENFANNFRDSFRIFKNALIKDNNLLDASKFHRYELYCKEIELKQNWYKEGINPQNQHDVVKNTWRIRDLVDFLLLGFYRKLSDHHTDFLKVFNNLVLLISLYTAFFMGLFQIHKDNLKDNKAHLTLFSFFDTYESWIVCGAGFVLMFGCVWILFKYSPYSKTSIKDIFEIYKTFPILVKDFCEFFKSILMALFFVSFFTFCFFTLYKLSNLVLYEFFILDKDLVYSIFINVLFVSLYLSFVYTKSSFFVRYILLGISYVWFIVIMIQHPDIIHPLVFNSINEIFNYLPLTTLVIVYTILLGLVLFSLQKTARKNSVVPN